MRIFIAIGQTPFDPTSGAAQATLHLAELLAHAGCEVRCLATSGTEGVCKAELPTGAFHLNRVRYQILSVPAAQKHSWHHLIGREYDACFAKQLDDFRPDFLFTFGDEGPDRTRRKKAATAGVKVVFCLHNGHYQSLQPEMVTAFLAPSRFLADFYRTAWAHPVPIHHLPTPIMPARVIAESHDPVFTTFINPQPAKGLWFMIRLAEQLGLRHPEIPLRIIEGRATAADFLAAAKYSGIDLGGFPNLFFSPNFEDVREVWTTTRVLLVPSVWEEPAGRVAVEAMFNGAVPIVSNRGGLSEQVGSGGRILPIPEILTPESRCLPSAREVEPWLEAIVELSTDERLFTETSKRAMASAHRFTPDLLVPEYLQFLNECWKTA